MVKFLDLDYWKQVETIANSDEEFNIKTKGFVASFTFKVSEGADRPPVYVKFDNGQVTEVRALNEGEKTDFTLEGPYDVWTQVNKGEVDGANAIMTRMLQFKGNMSAIIRYSKAFLRLFQLMQEVPVNY
ncbi:MAG TPA: SCP2 sterol-binding domain-containing protein [Patescibacteria group bacterium]|nr:SCP2 sterol-binding domain-containing protein [Patescibacteria group bacterium]